MGIAQLLGLKKEKQNSDLLGHSVKFAKTSSRPEQEFFNPEYDYVKAIKALNNKDYLSAFEYFKNVLKFDEKDFFNIMILLYKKLFHQFGNVDLRFLIAKLYLVQGEYDQALDELEEILDMGGQNSDLFELLRKIYFENKARNRIRRIFENAFNIQVDDKIVFDFLGQIYLEENNISGGIELYKRMISFEKKSVSLYKNLAQLYVKKGELKEAFAVYEKILVISVDLAPYIAQKIEELLNKDEKNIIFREKLIKIYFSLTKIDKVQEHLNKICAVENEEKSRTVFLYKEALDLFPDVPEIVLDLVDVLIDIKQYTEAVFYLRKVYDKCDKDKDLPLIIQEKCEAILKVFPKQVAGILFISDIHFEFQRYKKSLEVLESIMDFNTDDLAILEDKVKRCFLEPRIDLAYYLKMKIDYLKGNYEQVLTMYDSLMHSEYEFQARSLQVDVYCSQKEWGKALRLLFDNLKINPYKIELHNKIKNVEFMIFDAEIAKRKNIINKKISQNKAVKNKKKLNFEIGLLYLRKGDLEEAIKAFQTLNPMSLLGNQAQILLGRCFMELGRFDMAINHLTRSLAQIENQDIHLANKIRYMMAINYYLLGKIGKALEVLDSIIEYDIDFPQIKEIIYDFKHSSFLDIGGKILGVSNTFLKEPKLICLALYNSNLMKTSGFKEQFITMSFSQNHIKTGLDCMQKDNLKVAEESFEVATQLDPNLVAPYCNLGAIYIQKQKYDEALENFNKAKELDDKNEAVYLGLGAVWFLKKDYAKAKGFFEKVLMLNSKNQLARLNLGDIYYKQGKIAEAFKLWQRACKDKHLFYLVQRRIFYLKQESLKFSDWIDNFEVNIDDLLLVNNLDKNCA